MSAALTSRRRFRPPWTIEDYNDGCFIGRRTNKDRKRLTRITVQFIPYAFPTLWRFAVPIFEIHFGFALAIIFRCGRDIWVPTRGGLSRRRKDHEHINYWHHEITLLEQLGSSALTLFASTHSRNAASRPTKGREASQSQPARPPVTHGHINVKPRCRWIAFGRFCSIALVMTRSTSSVVASRLPTRTPKNSGPGGAQKRRPRLWRRPSFISTIQPSVSGKPPSSPRPANRGRREVVNCHRWRARSEK